MFRISITGKGGKTVVESDGRTSLLETLRTNGTSLYAPCGGKGTCGKCRVVLKGDGEILACRHYPSCDVEVILPGEEEASILVNQTEFLEDMPFDPGIPAFLNNEESYGAAIDIGTTTVVIYFVNLRTGQIVRISSFLNPQKAYGADVISRIGYCQEHPGGLSIIQKAIVRAINDRFSSFLEGSGCTADTIERVYVAGNTTMLHMLLGVDPVPIALAPFTPGFVDKQITTGKKTGLMVHEGTEIVTLPCISAYVGADIVAGLTALKVVPAKYLFLDIGTNGEMALISGNKIYTCSTAAGPAFEGANITCGMGAVTGAITSFNGPDDYKVIGNTEPSGICGSAIVDLIAYLLQEGYIDETGLMKEDFIIYPDRAIRLTQQDVREVQLAKSAIYSGMKILLCKAGLTFDDIEALYLAGGFGNYINACSATRIGLLPPELKGRIYPVGNSAGIGALQYLKSIVFREKTEKILRNTSYIELSAIDEFTLEFAMNMDFRSPA